MSLAVGQSPDPKAAPSNRVLHTLAGWRSGERERRSEERESVCVCVRERERKGGQAEKKSRREKDR